MANDSFPLQCERYGTVVAEIGYGAGTIQFVVDQTITFESMADLIGFVMTAEKVGFTDKGPILRGRERKPPAPRPPSKYLFRSGDTIIGEAHLANGLIASDVARDLCRQRCYFSVEVFVTIAGNPFFASREDTEVEAIMREEGYGR